MKKLVLLSSFVLLAANISFAATMKDYNYPEISMEAPSSLDVNKNNFKDRFPTQGCCYIKPKAIAVMVIPGKFPDLPSMQKSMTDLSGVQLKDWDLTDQASKEAKGWVWRKEFQTNVSDKTVYTVLGHGEKAAYLIMLCADKKAFTANPGDYKAWRKSLRVGPKAKAL